MNWQRNDRQRRLHQKPLLEIHAPAVDPTDSIELVAQRELIERLYQAIHRLPKEDVALVLLYLDDLSYRETASVLGISENNVGVRLNRAKKALAAMLNAPSMEGDSSDTR